ncbi:helix-turn-helix transcriptional regulator [Mycetocola tolaasinivorans]|nr:helix-turn-helix domain-containing protein [Mycetocola tolaasinivorans]
MYAETRLSDARTLWRSLGGAGGVIPADGSVDLILRGGDLFLAGPSTRAITTLPDADGVSIGLRFAPGQAAATLGIDLAELRDTGAPLGDVLDPARTRELATRVRAQARNPGHDLLGGQPEDPWARETHRAARRAESASALARRLGWSERQLRRRMLARFGYGYAALIRIERAKRAHALIRSGTALAEAAARAGYSDQPHLTREFRRVVGHTPGEVSAAGD